MCFNASFNACPHGNGEQIKQLYNLAIIRYITMISLSFERIPELEASRKRGLPPDLCTNKVKPVLVRSALRTGPGFDNRRFSFYNLAELEHTSAL